MNTDMQIPTLQDWHVARRVAPLLPAIAYSITCNGRHTGVVHTDYFEAEDRLRDLNKRYPAEIRKIVRLVAAE